MQKYIISTKPQNKLSIFVETVEENRQSLYRICRLIDILTANKLPYNCCSRAMYFPRISNSMLTTLPT